MASMQATEGLGGDKVSYLPDLVVAVEHTREVADVLTDLGVAVGEIEGDESLGLSLVPLPVESAGEYRRAVPDTNEDTVDLDRLLAAVRERFRSTYAGWVPTIGKNRLLDDVLGGGKISHGGALAPAEATAELPAREAGPGHGVRVGVLDTAMSAHPWLAGGWVAAPDDVLEDGKTYSAIAGHATFITGLVLREAPGCVVVARQVLAHDGSADSWSVAKEIVQHGRDGLDVLNLSLFCHTTDGQPPLVLARAIDRLPSDTVVVAAAGNYAGDGGPLADPRQPAWPAALDGVIAVGAVDDAGNAADFSPTGVPWVDVLAPGVECVSTYLDGQVSFSGGKTAQFGGLARWSGTSFAAGTVSGAIAARTVPGRVSARQAWESLREEGERPFVLGLGR